MSSKMVAIIGGGAAGFFFAINYKSRHPEDKVTIYEQGKSVLNKVKVSGGGRCNVTHACFDPAELVQFYPRGKKELLGPFHRWACGDTVEWFESRGVPLKIEGDGRMFPESNNSETIIDCFIDHTRQLGIEVNKLSKVNIVSLTDRKILIGKDTTLTPDILFLATGSSKKVWTTLHTLGVSIIDPVPSLFTFNIMDSRLKDLAGLAFNEVEVKSEFGSYHSRGPLLITHWGLSAPAILKLSSVEARLMAQAGYSFKVTVDFLPDLSREEVGKCMINQGGKQIGDRNPFGIPKRYWKRMIDVIGIKSDKRWADLRKEERLDLEDALKSSVFQVKGKSTFKEEFVSAGGIDLKEIDFRNFALKRFPGVYAAGEILNIDAMTGGFNFQAAWTGAFIAAANA